MSEMVERVARAIAEADGEDYMEDAQRYDASAKAAIRAMREPTERMTREGFRNNRHINPTSCDKPTCIGAITMPADKAWRAMIDEAQR